MEYDKKINLIDIKKTYKSMLDEKSKKIFALRLLFNLTNDFEYIYQMVSEIPQFMGNDPHPHLEFYMKSKECVKQGKKLIFYGAASFTSHLFEFCSNNRYFNYAMFKEIPWECFCDKDIEKQKEKFYGHSVISPKLLIDEYRDDIVVVGTWGRNEEIKNYLVELGFPKDNIIFYPSAPADLDIKFLSEEQYFDKEFMKPQNNEIFVDAGAFDCDTAIQFISWCNGKYEKIYSFEPDEKNYELCKESIKKNDIHQIELVNAGLSDINQTLSFSNEGSGGSCLVEESNYKVKVVSLDSFLQGKKATFIKMDIEGSELQALKGASETIKNFRPRLAISLYHKPEDIVNIPMYIKSLDENYRFYIRHYSNFGLETVLYAIHDGGKNEMEE